MKKALVMMTLLVAGLMMIACDPPEDITIDTREEQFEDGATEVTMWVNDFEEWNNQLNFSQRKDFNDNLEDGIQLEQVLVDVDNFEDLIRSARESGNVPDIYMVSYGNLYKEVQNGYAADLTDLLPQSAWDDLSETAESGVKYEDNYYGYPKLLEPSTLLFYRKDLLQTYGETDTIPTDWDGFVTLLRTIDTNIDEAGTEGLYPFDVPKGIALGWGSWGLQISSTGGLAITEDWSESRLLNPGYKDLAELWQTLYTERLVPLASGNYTEIINDLALDKLVMTTAGSWSIATIINEYPDMVDDIGVMPMPTFDGNQDKPTATNGGWVYVISEQSEHKEEAAEVIEYLVAGDISVPLEYFRGARYSKASPRVSVQEAIIDDLDDQTAVPDEWITVMSDVAGYAPMEPIYPWDISVAVSSLLENVALGNDVDDEITNAHLTVEGIIEDNNLANNNPRA